MDQTPTSLGQLRAGPILPHLPLVSFSFLRAAPYPFEYLAFRYNWGKPTDDVRCQAEGRRIFARWSAKRTGGSLRASATSSRSSLPERLLVCAHMVAGC